MFFDSKSTETETIINTGNLVTKNVQKLTLKFAQEKDHLKLKENLTSMSQRQQFFDPLVRSLRGFDIS